MSFMELKNAMDVAINNLEKELYKALELEIKKDSSNAQELQEDIRLKCHSAFVRPDIDASLFRAQYMQEPIILLNNDEVSLKTIIDTYSVGETVIYQNGNKFELGIIKSVCGNDEYFVNYHTGDTAARTHAIYLHKIANSYAFHVYRLDTEDNERK